MPNVVECYHDAIILDDCMRKHFYFRMAHDEIGKVHNANICERWYLDCGYRIMHRANSIHRVWWWVVGI